MLKLSRTLTIVVSSAVAAVSSYAAELETATRAPIQNLVPGLYSKVELSHHRKNQTKSPEDGVRVEATYTLGSTFFNNLLDTSVMLGVKKHADSAKFYSKSVNWETYLTAYDNNLVQVKPYLLASLPYTDHTGAERSTEGQFGVKVPLKHNISTGAGVVSVGGFYDVSAKVNNRGTVPVLGSDDKPYTTRDGSSFGLTKESEAKLGLTANDKGEYETSPRALGLRQDAAIELGFAPNFVSGLAFEWRSRYRIDSTPVMEFDNATGRLAPRANRVLGQDYTNASKTTHRLRTKYDLTKVFYLQNDFDFEQNVAADGTRAYSNVFAVGANLL